MRLTVLLTGLGLMWAAQPAEARTVLTQPTTCYVNMTGGSASNSGLSPGAAKASGQQCVDLIANTWDRAGHDATIQYAGGQTDPNGLVIQEMVGNGFLIVDCGSGGGISSTGDERESVKLGKLNKMGAIVTWGAVGKVRLQHCRLDSYGSWGFGIIANSTAWIEIGDGVKFGAAGTSHITAAATGAVIFIRSPYSIVGSTQIHIIAGNGGMVMGDNFPSTVTFEGNPYVWCFVLVAQNATVFMPHYTYTGASRVAYKYITSQNGTVRVDGTTVFPGYYVYAEPFTPVK
jgi:hypothetical protein